MGGKGGGQRTGPHPSVIPPTLSTQANYWYRKPQGFFGGFPPLQHAFTHAAEREKVAF